MPSIGMRILALCAAVVMTAAVSACGGSPAAQPPANHNSADVTFADKMIPHHRQALDMSALVPSRTTNHELIVMAQQIALEQQAQIDTLQGLLQQWGEPSAPHQMAGMDPGMDMDGMVDAATMAKLPTLNGAEFDDLWLRSMITHHQGAVAMAEPEIAHGQDPAAVKMAKIIVDWQQLEIGRMHAMLGPAE